jgi:hypothetical protein
MNGFHESINLAVAGFLILQDCDEARLSDEYRQAFGSYCGVDRLPHLFPSDPVIRQMIGEPAIQDTRLAGTIDEWFDSSFGNTAFIAHHNQAIRLFDAFKSFGFRFELVCCQLAWREGENKRLSDYPKTEERFPQVSGTYGFDVSWPTCNHSAIFQPGIVPTTLSWKQKLNPYGLLNDYKDAAMLRDDYLAIYPHPPFDIFLVHKVATE